MILISLAQDGSAVCRYPQQLAQGTNSENIVLASPFPARVPILMGWVMPDGTPLEQWVDPSDHAQGKTKYFAMTNVIDGGDLGVGNEAPLSVWTFRPDKAFTAQYGTAYACFYAQLQDQNGGVSYRKLTTNLVAIEVLETIKPDIDDDAPEGSLLEEILQAITYYNEYLGDIAENGVSTVFNTLGEAERKVYTDAIATLGSLNLITSDAVAQALNAAKDYADGKATDALNSAKSYTDEKTQNMPVSPAQEQAIAAAEQRAKQYADGKDTETLNSAKSYTDGKVAIINEQIERLEGRVIYCAYDGEKFQLPLGSIEDGKHYTLVLSMTDEQYNSKITVGQAIPSIYVGNTARTGISLYLAGDRFGLTSGTTAVDFKYYELPKGILGGVGNHIFVFSGVASYYQSGVIRIFDFRLDKNIADDDSVAFHPSDYALVPYSVLKPVSQKADQNAADIVTVNTKIADESLRIANLENALYDYVLGKDEETFDNLKNAILPSSITVDNTVYPIADGTRGILAYLKGNTKKFNQIARSMNNTYYYANNATISYNGDEVTVTAAQQYGALYTRNSVRFIQGHKYYFSIESISSTGTQEVRMAVNYIFPQSKLLGNFSISETFRRNQSIMVCDRTASSNISIQDDASANWTSFTVKNFMIVDLTAMGLDSITSADEITALYPKSYYPYNAGTLYDSVISGVSLTGRNLWDEQWELGKYNTITGEAQESTTNIRNKNSIKVIGGSTLYFKCPAMANVFCYDVNNDLIQILFCQNETRTLLSVLDNRIIDHINFYMSSEYGTTYNNDICINVSDASFNGQYAPYALHTINLPSAQTLGGVGTAHDEWKVTRNENDDYYTEKKTIRVKTIDLSTLTFTESGGVYSATISDIKSGTANYVLSMYSTEATVNGTTLEITTSSAPTGNITYELATPVETILTETATLAEVSAIRENGGLISVVGNTNEDYAQPDVSEYVTYEKADLTGGN